MKYILPIDYTTLSAKARKSVREQYVKEQGNCCMYCGESLSKKAPSYVTSKQIDLSLFPPGFLKNPVHLQHDHYSGMTEGAVHAYCNAVLWQYEGK
jgi:hypothetical protein